VSDAPAHPPLVLVVDDERPMRRFLAVALDGSGYRMIEAATGEEALREVAMRSPDIVLLDLGLPDVDGVVVTRRLREWFTGPIIVLSARGQERDKIAALDAGADDYVTKPFAVGELMARMRAALRHRARAESSEAEGVILVGPLQIDLVRRLVTMDGREVRLTPIEYRLLATLARHRGRVLTHAQLLGEVWGPRHTAQPHTLRVYMAQLRHKIEPEPSRPRFLITEAGVGYRLRDS
jgi:two-component system KDP operon response regulator KdpE